MVRIKPVFLLSVLFMSLQRCFTLSYTAVRTALLYLHTSVLTLFRVVLYVFLLTLLYVLHFIYLYCLRSRRSTLNCLTLLYVLSLLYVDTCLLEYLLFTVVLYVALRCCTHCSSFMYILLADLHVSYPALDVILRLFLT